MLSACSVFNSAFSSYPELKLSLHSQAFSVILLGAFPITLSRDAALGTGNQRLNPRHPEVAPLLLCLVCGYQALTQLCIFSPKLPHWAVRRKWFGLVFPCRAALLLLAVFGHRSSSAPAWIPKYLHRSVPCGCAG